MTLEERLSLVLEQIGADIKAINNTRWSLLGNAGTNPANHFIGTTDNQPLVFRTNNSERLRILSNGNIGIGTTVDAGFRLDVNGTFRAQNTGAGDHTAIFSKSLGGITNAYNATTRNLLTVTGTPTTNGYQSAALKNKLDISAGSTYLHTSGHEWSAMTNELSVSSGGSVVQGADSISNTRIGSTIGYSRSIGTLTNHLIGTANYNIVGTVYDIFLAGVGGNQPTNYWGIYQQSSIAKNYFNGKILIGTTTDAGFRLDVNGSARIGGSAVRAEFDTVNGNFRFRGGNGNMGVDLGYSALNSGGYIQSSNNGLILGSFLWVENGSQARFVTRNVEFNWDIHSAASWNIRDLVSANVLFRVNTNGNVLIGTTTNIATAILNLTSTTKGFLPPRMTTEQRDAIVSPATGLVLFNTTTDTLQVRASTGWINL
jgi:hypothetical protein